MPRKVKAAVAVVASTRSTRSSKRKAEDAPVKVVGDVEAEQVEANGQVAANGNVPLSKGKAKKIPSNGRGASKAKVAKDEGLVEEKPNGTEATDNSKQILGSSQEAVEHGLTVHSDSLTKNGSGGNPVKLSARKSTGGVAQRVIKIVGKAAGSKK